MLTNINKYHTHPKQKTCFFTSRALATDATGQLHVLGEDGDTPAVDGKQVGVHEEIDEIVLRCLLQRLYGAALEAEIGAKVQRNLANQALEWELADEAVGGLLVLADLAKGDSTRLVAALGDLLLLQKSNGSHGGKVLGVLLASKDGMWRGARRGVLHGGLLHACHAKWFEWV
jgi:hypothetical protein